MYCRRPLPWPKKSIREILELIKGVATLLQEDSARRVVQAVTEQSEAKPTAGLTKQIRRPRYDQAKNSQHGCVAGRLSASGIHSTTCARTVDTFAAAQLARMDAGGATWTGSRSAKRREERKRPH